MVHPRIVTLCQTHNKSTTTLLCPTATRQRDRRTRSGAGVRAIVRTWQSDTRDWAVAGCDRQRRRSPSRVGRTLRVVPDAVVFDLDGVLVDSEQLWNAAKEAFVRDAGGRWREDAPRAMMGMSSPEWSAYIREQLGVDLEDE